MRVLVFGVTCCAHGSAHSSVLKWLEDSLVSDSSADGLRGARVCRVCRVRGRARWTSLRRSRSQSARPMRSSKRLVTVRFQCRCMRCACVRARRHCDVVACCAAHSHVGEALPLGCRRAQAKTARSDARGETGGRGVAKGTNCGSRVQGAGGFGSCVRTARRGPPARLWLTAVAGGLCDLCGWFDTRLLRGPTQPSG